MTIRDPQRLLFAIFLLAFGGCGLLFGANLPMGTTLHMGPGYVPKVLCGIVLAFGVGLAASSLVVRGPQLERWAWRGLVIVLGSLCLFGVMVEHVGLVVTTIVTVLVATAAAPDRRWREATIFAVVMAAFCTALFRIALGLPMPALPW
jgi:hypothetical protein